MTDVKSFHSSITYLMHHLEKEITLRARPLAVHIQRILGQEVASLAGLAEDG